MWLSFHAGYAVGADTAAKGITAIGDRVYLIVENYFREFQNAYFEYEAKLIAGDTVLVANFDRALAGSTITDDVRSVESPSADAASFATAGASASAAVIVRNPTSGDEATTS